MEKTLKNSHRIHYLASLKATEHMRVKCRFAKATVGSVNSKYTLI